MSVDNPLEFVTTTDMIAEIRRRHPTGALIVTVTDLDANRESYLAYWSGGPMVVMGMAEYARLTFGGNSMNKEIPGVQGMQRARPWEKDEIDGGGL
jgi:hypothetical protein